jgi:NAD kinase
VPLYQLVPVRGPDGEILEAYRGVQRQDTKEVVSVTSQKCGLVQNFDLVKALHAVGKALESPGLRTRCLRRAPTSTGRA